MEDIEFSLVRAKAGDPIEYHGTNGWTTVHFIGVTKSGLPVIQHMDQYAVPFAAETTRLRMAPKKVTWYCRHHVYDGMPTLYRSLMPIAENAADSWLGAPFTIEVAE